MTKTLDILQNDIIDIAYEEQLEREREQFIDDNALVALRLELAGLAIKAVNTPTPESYND